MGTPISVRLDPSTIAEIDATRLRFKLSRTELLRLAIETYLRTVGNVWGPYPLIPSTFVPPETPS
jgi:Ribbon-helix-helix protein, copG family